MMKKIKKIQIKQNIKISDSEKLALTENRPPPSRARPSLKVEPQPQLDGSSCGKAIQARIASAKQELEPQIPDASPAAGAQLAWRMVVDLVAGVSVGAAAGYGLGILFGYTPYILAAFTLLGFAAGVNLMLRTAREFQRKDADRHAPGG